MTEDSTSIALQERIKFFFSDANFRSDKFMQNEAKSNDGYIEITSLLKFSTVKKLTTDVKVVAEAAKNVDNVVLSKDGEAIRRANPIPDNYDSNLRTVVVFGIPTADVKKEEEKVKKEEEKAKEETKEGEGEGDAAAEEKKEEEKAPQEYSVTIADVKAAFSKHGEVALVRMRYSRAIPEKEIVKSAIGSCFVEFGSEEEQKKAVEAKDEKVRTMREERIHGVSGKGGFTPL